MELFVFCEMGQLERYSQRRKVDLERTLKVFSCYVSETFDK